MSKDNFQSKCTSRCFLKPALLNRILMKIILEQIFLVVFLLKMTSSAYFVGSGLKFIFSWKANLFISLMPLFRLLAVFTGITVENRDVSLVNNL